MREETPDDPWIQEADEMSTMTSNDQRNQIIDVEANLVSSTIMTQTPDPMESKFQNQKLLKKMLF